MAPAPTTNDPVTAYARAATTGEIAVGKLVHLACARHLRDLETGHTRGLEWKPDRAAAVVRFFSLLSHSKGEWAGRPFVLEPWQCFIAGSLWGWLRADTRLRRFRTGYSEIARKNGKSSLAAGVGLFLAFFDGEPGAEVYTAATKRDQARIVHGEAVRMVRASANLRKLVKAQKDNLHSLETGSKYEPLGADADSTDGLNVHGVIIDELHAHKTRALLDVLETATGARRQPLVFVITTAGVGGAPSVCWDMHEYARRVLEGQVEDDSFFAYVAAIDAGDDWKEEACWAKANPNLGVSVKPDDLRRKRDRAVEMPSAQAAFRQKHLDEWVQAAEVWIPDDRWMRGQNAAPLDAAGLLGRECYGGLDLANTLDLCAFVLAFPLGEVKEERRPDGAEDDRARETQQAEARPPLALAESYAVLAWFWVPEEPAAERERANRQTYRHWIDQGLITATEGDVTDYDVIRADLGRLRGLYDVRGVAYDQFNATQLANQLTQDGFAMEKFVQNMASFNEPCVVLEKLAAEGRLRHGGNPVLRWMAGNVVVVRNGLGHMMPARKRSADKIDGVVALLEALSWAVLKRDGGGGWSGGLLD